MPRWLKIGPTANDIKWTPAYWDTLDGILGGLQAQAIAVGTPAVYTGTGATVAAQVLDVNHGSDAVPVTVAGPTVRIARVENLPVASIGGAGGTQFVNEANAALVVTASGHGSGAAGTEMQTNAIFCYAVTDGVGSWDAVGVQAVGRAQGSSTHLGTGAYLEGRKDSPTTKVVGVEIRATNADAANTAGDSTYSSSGASNLTGLWITCDAKAGANPTLGAALQIGRIGSAQWGVGIGIVSSAVLTTSIRDDSNSATSIQINGTHGTASLSIANSAGPILIGTGNNIGIFGHAASGQQTVTGSRGANVALASLLTALAAYGLVVDSSTV